MLSHAGRLLLRQGFQTIQGNEPSLPCQNLYLHFRPRFDLREIFITLYSPKVLCIPKIVDLARIMLIPEEA